jgi:hypothetical protein
VSDVAATTAVKAPSAQPAPQAAPELGHAMWSHGSFSFKDLVDIVNPLQHLPVVGSVYRYLTGDEPSAGTRVIGDSLYGGPIGFGVSVVSTALLTNESGQDLGERMLADVFGSRDHGSPTLGAPQVADNQPAAPMPDWMASAGTPDGQPRTPAPANQQNAAFRTATATPAAKAISSAPSSRPVAALPARGIAASSAPISLAVSARAAAQPLSQPLVTTPAEPVAMNDLFRSAPPAPASPEEAFTSQASQFERQISQGRGTNGAVLNNRGVPLELSSNLLPVMPTGGHLALGPSVAAEPGQAKTPAAAASSQAQALPPAAATAPDQNAIAQKMLDALNKYEQLKKQEEQQDRADKADQAKLDLSL